jgi:tetratricopeptide (TPR) repeat protein
LQPVNGLQVKGRASSFYFKGKNERLQKIGQDLQVKYVVEGTVSRAGNTLRITVDLVTAGDETQLWAMKYDRPLDDLLAIRTDVATRVAEALKGKLLGEERQQLAKRGTENAEAYRLYLRGSYLASRGTDENLKQAIECFGQAIAMDPGYALSHAALAGCYYDLDYYTGQPVSQTFPKAQAAALKALELDGTLAEARLVLAAIKFRLSWDWKGAEEEYRRIITLNPNSATAHDRLSSVLFSQRRFAEAATEMKFAQELEPLSPGMNIGLAFCLSYDGKADLGIEILRQQIAQNPSSVQAHNGLGWVYFDQGKWAEAVAAFETVRKLKGSGIWEKASLGCAYARVGRTNEAREILRQLQELPRQGLNYHVSVGAVQHALGDDEAALDSLENALAVHASGLTALNWGILWKELRPHPRAQAILKKMNLVK